MVDSFSGVIDHFILKNSRQIAKIKEFVLAVDSTALLRGNKKTNPLPIKDNKEKVVIYRYAYQRKSSKLCLYECKRIDISAYIR